MEDSLIQNNFFYIAAYSLLSLVFMATEERIGFPTALAASFLYYLIYETKQDYDIRNEMGIGGWEKVTWRHRMMYNRSSNSYAWFWPLWLVMIVVLAGVVFIFGLSQAGKSPKG
ncbi:hypothetical protein [Candidatus Magnetobacterium casense]|uniref:Transmembrane protein n=1 Tax=Candidatus Magnetobacterium casense TaxID=1455061 RepID=A0ABS6RWC8_9BACT|nr:hypothetical protein [Candidatus Magnetobacterium casensis]MBV6340098.1 hypothetical protein [Candidatus Magnetobacterium casensis]